MNFKGGWFVVASFKRY
jgi:hypothetical protein